jgi:hypothetical protein
MPATDLYLPEVSRTIEAAELITNYESLMPEADFFSFYWQLRDKCAMTAITSDAHPR